MNYYSCKTNLQNCYGYQEEFGIFIQRYLNAIFFINNCDLFGSQKSFGNSVRPQKKFPVGKHYICIIKDQKAYFQNDINTSGGQ